MKVFFLCTLTNQRMLSNFFILVKKNIFLLKECLKFSETISNIFFTLFDSIVELFKSLIVFHSFQSSGLGSEIMLTPGQHRRVGESETEYIGAGRPLVHRAMCGSNLMKWTRTVHQRSTNQIRPQLHRFIRLLPHIALCTNGRPAPIYSVSLSPFSMPRGQHDFRPQPTTPA